MGSKCLKISLKKSPGLRLSLLVGGYTNHVCLYSFICSFIHSSIISHNSFNIYLQMDERNDRVSGSIKGRKRSNYKFTLFLVPQWLHLLFDSLSFFRQDTFHRLTFINIFKHLSLAPSLLF